MMYKAPIALCLAALLMSLAWAQQTETDPVEPQDQAQAETVAADGPMVIPASEAPIVIDSDRNRYDLRTGVTEFNDNVSIERGPMEISADRGVIKQVDGEMTEIELFGSPVEWRDQLEDGSIVSGEATNIYFDIPANIVTLTGNAVIRHEQGEFTGDQLVYNLDTESLSGSGDGDNRARVVIEPGALPEDP